MARFMLYALGVIGLANIAAWILLVGADFDPGGAFALLIYVSWFLLPLLSAVAAVWLVYDLVRRFVRCRLTRTA